MSNCVEKDEDRSKSPVPSCPSLKSDKSKDEPEYFSNEPGPSDTNGQYNRQRAEYLAPSCPSLTSDCSKGKPKYFSNEPAELKLRE